MKKIGILLVLVWFGVACGGNGVEEMEAPSLPAVPGSGDLESLRPPARAEMMGVFDPVRRQLVFFGGDDEVPLNCTARAHVVGIQDTWVYDAATAQFKEVATTNPPPARARGMAVYDSFGDRMILFGGRSRATSVGAYTNYNDVWALDLNTLRWEELVTSGPAPKARSNPAGGFNPVTNEMIVVGGNTSTSGLSFAPHNDVWAFHLERKTWRVVSPLGEAPEARRFHAAALDSENNRLFVYGGGGAGAWQGPFLGDLWQMELSTGAWSALHRGEGEAPLGRIWSTVTYDQGKNRLLLFGGHDDGAIGNTNDTWEFDLTAYRWKVLVEPEPKLNEPIAFCEFPPEFTEVNLEAPERRSAHMAGLDTTRMEWIVFGGKTDCGLVDDVWVFDLARDGWFRLAEASVGESCVRGDQPDLCVALCQ